MIVKQTPRLATSTRAVSALLASSAVFFAGCSNMASTAPAITGSDSGAAAQVTLSGHVHGGVQPVTNAIVTLWFAGQKPTAARVAAATTSGTDGTFSFVQDAPGTSESGTSTHFACPTTSPTNPLVYVTATGGNTQNNGDASQDNTAAAFIGVYGMCNDVTLNSKFITLSEVTTVATMVAVHQFFDPVSETLSWDGTGQQGLLVPYVPSTIGLLADVSTGTAVTSTTLGSGPVLTATPEAGKINLLANILAACINTADSSAPGCTGLFANAVPPQPKATADEANTDVPSTFSAATDTMQALYYILTNPANGTVSNLKNLFNLPSGVGAPFQPALSAIPTDWNIGITYSSTSTCGSGGGGFISSPTEINIDAADHVWITNGQASIGNLSLINNDGTPGSCVNFGGGLNAGGVIDPNGASWVAVGTSIYRYSYGDILQFPLTAVANPTPIAVAVDGTTGNVFFTATDGTNGTAYVLPAVAPQTNASTGVGPVATAVAPVQIATNLGPNPIHLMPDSKGNIWISSGSSFITELVPGGSPNTYTSSTFSTGGTNSYGLIVGQFGNFIYTSDYTSGAITEIDNSTSNSTLWSYTSASAGIASPTTLLVDGQGNSWAANNANNTTGASPLGSISAVTNAPVALSPATGFQRANSILNSSRALAIDQQGNVWVGGDGNNFVTEFVGAAVPLFQPYSLGEILNNDHYFQNLP